MLVWLGALFVGFTVGLLGSGGSILTVPILVYLVGEAEKVAIAESLAIVGTIAVFAVVPFALKKRIEWRSVVLFGMPAMCGAYLGATLSMFVPGSVQLLGFALVLLVSAAFMLRPEAPAAQKGNRHYGVIMLDGVIVGTLTGLVGVGGGFLIVPALVVLGGLPMSRAVGTSLAIITLNAATGFYKHQDVLTRSDLSVNWELVVLFASLGILGSFAGGAAAHRLPQSALRRMFAVLLTGMGLFIITSSLSSLGVLHF